MCGKKVGNSVNGKIGDGSQNWKIGDGNKMGNKTGKLEMGNNTGKLEMGYKAEKLEMGVRFQKSLTNRGTPNFEDRNTRFLSSQMQKASFAPRARRLFSHLVGKSSTRAV